MYLMFVIVLLAGTSFGRPAECMDATGMERLIWEQMLERVNLWVESAIILRSYIDRPVYPIEATNVDWNTRQTTLELPSQSTLYKH